jgi:AcrR family transcriptional regulator
VSTRERCVHVALQLIAANGFNGTSMRDIAREAETSLSNLYNHFSAKSDVLVAVLREANDELLRRIREAVEAAGPSATDRLEAATAAYVAFAIECQTAAVVALSEFRYLKGAGRSEVVQARDTTESIFRQIISDGARDGEFGTPHPDDATRALVSMCSAMSAWYRPDGRMTPDELSDVQVRYALALVEAQVLHTSGTRRRRAARPAAPRRTVRRARR